MGRQPRTVAGQDLLHDLNFDPHQRQRLKSSILAIEDEAVRLLRELDTRFRVFLTMADKYHPDGGPAPAWLDFIRECAALATADVDEEPRP